MTDSDQHPSITIARGGRRREGLENIRETNDFSMDSATHTDDQEISEEAQYQISIDQEERNIIKDEDINMVMVSYSPPALLAENIEETKKIFSMESASHTEDADRDREISKETTSSSIFGGQDAVQKQSNIEDEEIDMATTSPALSAKPITPVLSIESTAAAPTTQPSSTSPIRAEQIPVDAAANDAPKNTWSASHSSVQTGDLPVMVYFNVPFIIKTVEATPQNYVPQEGLFFFDLTISKFIPASVMVHHVAWILPCVFDPWRGHWVALKPIPPSWPVAFEAPLEAPLSSTVQQTYDPDCIMEDAPIDFPVHENTSSQSEESNIEGQHGKSDDGPQAVFSEKREGKKRARDEYEEQKMYENESRPKTKRPKVNRKDKAIQVEPSWLNGATRRRIAHNTGQYLFFPSAAVLGTVMHPSEARRPATTELNPALLPSKRAKLVRWTSSVLDNEQKAGEKRRKPRRSRPHTGQQSGATEISDLQYPASYHLCVYGHGRCS